MKIPGVFYVNAHLRTLMFDELKSHSGRAGVGGFLPAVKQIANVACLPGIVNVRHCAATIRVPLCYFAYFSQHAASSAC